MSPENSNTPVDAASAAPVIPFGGSRGIGESPLSVAVDMGGESTGIVSLWRGRKIVAIAEVCLSPTDEAPADPRIDCPETGV